MNDIGFNGTVMTASSFLGAAHSEGERSETERSAAPRNGAPPDPEVLASRTRRRFTAAYKQRILKEAEACRETGRIGALLRREGLYSSHLAVWRKQAACPPKRRGRRPKDAALAAHIQENRTLQRENARLERRLARAEAVIDIQKKVSELLGIPLSQPESEGSG